MLIRCAGSEPLPQSPRVCGAHSLLAVSMDFRIRENDGRGTSHHSSVVNACCLLLFFSVFVRGKCFRSQLVHSASRLSHPAYAGLILYQLLVWISAFAKMTEGLLRKVIFGFKPLRDEQVFQKNLSPFQGNDIALASGLTSAVYWHWV